MTVGINDNGLDLKAISDQKDKDVTQDDLNAWGDTLEDLDFPPEIVALVEDYLIENPDADHKDIELFLKKYDTDGNGDLDGSDADAINAKASDTVAFDYSDIEDLDPDADVNLDDVDKWMDGLEKAGVDNASLANIRSYLHGVTIDGTVTNGDALALFKELDANGDNDIDAIDSYQIDADTVNMSKKTERLDAGEDIGRGLYISVLNSEEYADQGPEAIALIQDDLAAFKDSHPNAYAQITSFIDDGADFATIQVLLEQVAMLAHGGASHHHVGGDDLDVLEENAFEIGADGKISFDDGAVRTGIAMREVGKDGYSVTDEDLMDELAVFEESYPDLYLQIREFADDNPDSIRVLLENIAMLDDNSPNVGLPTMHLDTNDFDFLKDKEFTINSDGTLTFNEDTEFPDGSNGTEFPNDSTNIPFDR